MTGQATGPLISVIMPLYNKRHYVLRAIKSVQNQTYRNWELIIIDDGSTDGSTKIIPQNEARIRLYRQQNKGPGAARNKGIEVASGKYVTFLDADDCFFPNKLEVESDLLLKNKGNWMISAGEYLSGSDLTVWQIKNNDGSDIVGGTSVFDNAFDQVTISGNHIDGVCIRTETLRLIGGFQESMFCYEITEFITRCALYEPRVVVHTDPLYRVNDVPGSAFKNRLHTIDGMRQLGERFYSLSSDYPDYSDSLILKSKKNLFSYVSALILANRKIEARHYLTKKFPYGHSKRWWKMWAGTWIPTWLLRNIYKSPL